MRCAQRQTALLFSRGFPNALTLKGQSRLLNQDLRGKLHMQSLFMVVTHENHQIIRFSQINSKYRNDLRDHTDVMDLKRMTMRKLWKLTLLG